MPLRSTLSIRETPTEIAIHGNIMFQTGLMLYNIKDDYKHAHLAVLVHPSHFKAAPSRAICL